MKICKPVFALQLLSKNDRGKGSLIRKTKPTFFASTPKVIVAITEAVVCNLGVYLIN